MPNRAIVLIAVTYVYFLIFAQFAFLARLAQVGIAGPLLKPVMAAMALGGILLSLLAPRVNQLPSPATRLRIALVACASAAFLALLPLSPFPAMAISALIGTGLGLLTVTLVTHLRQWLGPADPLLSTGIGTGLAYFLCNVPPFFAASAQVQSLAAGALCLLALAFTRTSPPAQPNPTLTSLRFPAVLISFTALVWLDSAAFFIIQNTPALKAGTWEGSLSLWVNAFLHFAAAILSVAILRRRGISLLLGVAFVSLAAACLLLPHAPHAASFFYPVGVSLYSVALVAYPSLLAPATDAAQRARRAGWIYAIAGWFGSALGIGMGQNLGQVPPLFLAIAAAAMLTPFLLRHRRRELTATAAVLLAAFALHRAISAISPPQPATSAIARGRQVYIDEGCIHCHSQYVRPNTADVPLWGPAQPLERVRNQQPPLIGNRRQGPDLSQVGARRSPRWMKDHFLEPSSVSHASFMPSYRYLFNGQRGDDLIAYLQNLHTSGEQP